MNKNWKASFEFEFDVKFEAFGKEVYIKMKKE